MSSGCECYLCTKEREWAAEHPGVCYRCANGIPCQIAEEDGEPCCTVLDRMSLIRKD